MRRLQQRQVEPAQPGRVGDHLVGRDPPALGGRLDSEGQRQPQPSAGGDRHPHRAVDQHRGGVARAAVAPGDAPDLAAIARYRRLFAGPLIVNNGFDRESGNAVIEAGLADAVSFATHYIANPDLVTRFALGRDLAAGDPASYYAGSAGGFVDYPVSGWE